MRVRWYSFCLAVLVVLVGAGVALGDLVYLSSQGPPLEVQVLEMNAGSLTFKLPRERVTGLVVRASSPDLPDIVRVGAPAMEIQGKVVEMGREHLVFRVPRSSVVRLEMGVALSEPEKADRDVGGLPLPKGLAAKVEALEEKVSGLTKELKMEVREEVDKAAKDQGGSVVGKVVWNGKAHSGARVAIVKLNRLGFLDSMSRWVGRGPDEKPSVFEAMTDSQGEFSFKEVPAGEYDVYWKAGPAASWVRRLDETPDLVVKPRNTVKYREIEANVSTVN